MDYRQLIDYGTYCLRVDPIGTYPVLSNLNKGSITAAQAERALNAVTRRAAW